eukprot:4591670-Pleurochrysis_carterae.AAC.1
MPTAVPRQGVQGAAPAAERCLARAQARHAARRPSLLRFSHTGACGTYLSKSTRAGTCSATPYVPDTSSPDSLSCGGTHVCPWDTEHAYTWGGWPSNRLRTPYAAGTPRRPPTKNTASTAPRLANAALIVAAATPAAPADAARPTPAPP